MALKPDFSENLNNLGLTFYNHEDYCEAEKTIDLGLGIDDETLICLQPRHGFCSTCVGTPRVSITSVESST